MPLVSTVGAEQLCSTAQSDTAASPSRELIGSSSLTSEQGGRKSDTFLTGIHLAVITGEIPSGPKAFLDFCFLKTRLTSSTQTLSAGRMVGEGGCRGVGECVKCRSERVLGVSLAFSNRQ